MKKHEKKQSEQGIRHLLTVAITIYTSIMAGAIALNGDQVLAAEPEDEITNLVIKRTAEQIGATEETVRTTLGSTFTKIMAEKIPEILKCQTENDHDYEQQRINEVVTKLVQVIYDRDLLESASTGNEAGVREALEHGATPDVKDNSGFTPLMFASARGDQEIVQLLLDRHANSNIATNYGVTALLCATRGNQTEIVKLLLDHGADLNARDSAGCTALILAIKNGSENIVQLLLDHNADPNAKDGQGFTALIWASNNGFKDIVQLLLDHNADPNAKNGQGLTALMCASHSGSKDIVKLLLDHQVDLTIVNNDHQTAWESVGDGANKAEIQAMLRNFATEQLSAELSKDDPDQARVEKLVHAGADPNTKDKNKFTMLIVAIRWKNERLVKFLLDHGADPNYRTPGGYTALMWASIFINKGIVKLLLAHKADPNIVSNDDKTALNFAIKGSNSFLLAAQARKANHNIVSNYGSEIVQLLLDYGTYSIQECQAILSLSENSKPLVQDDKVKKVIEQFIRNNQLLVAIEKNDSTLAEQLIKAGADPNYVNNKVTPLILACNNGNFALVQLLLANKAELNNRDAKGNTPLICALQSALEQLNLKITGEDNNLDDCIKIINLLIEKNAYVLAENNQHQNAQSLLAELIESLHKELSLAEAEEIESKIKSLPAQVTLPPQDEFLAQKTVTRFAVTDEEKNGNLTVPEGADVYRALDDPSFGTDHLGSLFDNGISFDDIKQGSLGDCYFLSTLGSLAQKRPDLIKAMIKDNLDGTVTVRFFDQNGIAYYYTISKKLDDNFGAKKESALWVRLIEKAYALHCSRYYVNSTRTVAHLNQLITDGYNSRGYSLKLLGPTDKASSLNTRFFDNSTYIYGIGGLSNTAFTFLTGKKKDPKMDNLSLPLPANQQNFDFFLRQPWLSNSIAGLGQYSPQVIDFHNQLEQLFSSGEYALTADTGHRSEDGTFVSSHNYQVLGVKTIPQDYGAPLRLIEVRNPWGDTIPHYVNVAGDLKLKQSSEPSASCLVDVNDFIRFFEYVNIMKF